MGKSTDKGGGRPVGSSGPVSDPFDALPGLAPLRTAAWDGDWAATQAFFAGIGSADDVSFAAGALANVDRTETYLEAAVKALPDDPLPHTLLAERYVRVGWGIRSGARAQYVSRDQFEQFHSWLRKAEQLLIEVCARQPEYAPAWTARLLTARGLELGQSEARRRYERLAEHHPHHLRAQSLLVQQLCPKWGGTWEAAHGFAGECAAKAPDGSCAGALVAEAHIEHWLELDGAAATEYMRDVAVRDELRRAAQSSVLHPAHRPGWQSTGAHSAFALAFSLGGQLQDAAPHFAALGDTASESFWQYLPQWRSRFAHHRTAALATLRGGDDT
ncbi:tetratricopeptide repeat protein [Streptomyces sp. 7R007]